MRTREVKNAKKASASEDNMELKAMGAALDKVTQFSALALK